ncbi:hypothetical protein HQQ94_02775 [Shewanella sp. VB17]|uniref:hypothetical protein n=1 Tax=Shewanella sp. VB17 TaxID=2739432 RepID=UPI0015638181|nr:hypothetical protein [Shewanella sp. VB17]NRD72177.1 hypothetical protein [Shewanella sp. VB17]
MKTINNIEKCKITANKLRKIVRNQNEDESGEVIQSILQRFLESGELSHIKGELSQIKQLRLLPLVKYLNLIAYEAGYENWSSMKSSIKKDDEIGFSEETGLYKPRVSEFHLNVWCRNYEEAREYLDANKGYYLLQFKSSFFLALAPYIMDLGLDPKDKDWEIIDWDWVKPKDKEAKKRLLQKLQQACLSVEN